MTVVTLSRQPHEQLILIQPNRSSSWEANKCILIALALLNTLIAGAFAAMGAWLILPFAGLEIAGLLAGLYWVNWKLTYRHVLHFHGETLCIEKGFYHPKQSWEWPREESSLLVEQPERADEPLAIRLCRGGEEIELGEFLGREDSQQLLHQLRQQGLRVRAFSPASALSA